MASIQPYRWASRMSSMGMMITPRVTWKKSVRVVAHRPEMKVKAMITRKITAITTVLFQPV